MNAHQRHKARPTAKEQRIGRLVKEIKAKVRALPTLRNQTVFEFQRDSAVAHLLFRDAMR